MTRGLQRTLLWACAVLVSGLAPVACSGGDDGASDENVGGGGGLASGTGGRRGPTLDVDPSEGGSPASMGGGSTVEIVTELPEGFTAADGKGGWKVIGPLNEVPVADSVECSNVLRVLVRDFPASHPDFEEGSSEQVVLGMVERSLDDDKKPVYTDTSASNDKVTSIATFSQWYRSEEGVNQPFVVDLWLEPVEGTFVFDSAFFFPLDEVGFEDSITISTGKTHRFHFTTELHTRFEYKGGEEFTFRGDDDVWVFIHGQLAIDLGGVHRAAEGAVRLDDIAESFGLEVGNVYAFDLFQAERQTEESNFRMETTLDFTGCGEIIDTVIK